MLLIRALAPSGSEPQSGDGFSHSTLLLLMVQKSCTSWYGKCPIIYRVSYMLICWVVSRISSINSMLSFLVGSLGLKLMTRSCHTICYIWCVCLAVFFWERTENGGSGWLQHWFSKKTWHPCRRRGFRNSTSATAILSLAFHRRRRVPFVVGRHDKQALKHYETFYDGFTNASSVQFRNSACQDENWKPEIDFDMFLLPKNDCS